MSVFVEIHVFGLGLQKLFSLTFFLRYQDSKTQPHDCDNEHLPTIIHALVNFFYDDDRQSAALIRQVVLNVAVASFFFFF